MNLSRNQTIIIGGAILIIAFLVFAFVFFGRGGGGGLGGDSGEQIELNFWGVEDESAIRKLTELYSATNPGVRINYQRFEEDSYEKSLLNALASGQGPDIFMLHNTWLPKHYNKIAPLKEQLPLADFRNLFPTVVEQDFISENIIYSLPLYVDTLAFIYNKDYFDAKAVALPPKTWESFQNLISKLKETDFSGRISKAAAAIGGSEKSIDKASDLLSLIMLQYDVSMVDVQSSRADFSRTGGLNAFNFYLQFANPASQYYAWNDNLRPSLDNFANGTVGAIFNYSSAIPKVKAKNPFINIAVSPMLQFSNAEKPINYTDYWGLTVSSQSKNSAWAWHFIQSATTKEQSAEEYLKISGRPPALRSLINKYLNDSDLGVFANQALTASSWKQPDNNEVKKNFSNAIESVLNGRLSPQKALEEAENKINNL